MYRNLLVALELSDEKQDMNLLAAAAALADDGARIRCLHAVESLPIYAVAQMPEDIVPNMLRAATDDLEQRVAAAGLSATTEVRAGKPAAAVLEAAKEMGADAIIIGSHKPGMQDILLGSTAGRIVHHASCDVLVRRPG